MKTYRLPLLLLLFLSSCFFSYARIKSAQLQKSLYHITADKNATVGVAFSCGNDSYAFNDTRSYPLMSVFKFHVTLTALKKLENEKTDLSSAKYIPASQMHKNTYSPLRERYPDQDFYLSYKELIHYCIAESDNNACDILIDYVGGIKQVDEYIKTLGIADCQLTQTEETMHKDLQNCYRNWSSPSAMVKLLKKVYEENILTPPHMDFLEKVMMATTTGKEKIKAGLPAHIIIGHKTGSSDRIQEGIKTGDNDAGVIYLPDGRKCFLAVFIKDSKESDHTNAQIIADITKAIYKTLTQ